MEDVREIKRKFPGSLVGPFLCRNFTTLCDQEGGGDPRTFPLLYRVANMWWRQLNFNNISYKITSRPGEVFRFALFNIYFTSFGRSGSQLKGSKFGDSWTVQVYVTGSKVGFNFSCSNDPLTACLEKSQRFLGNIFSRCDGSFRRSLIFSTFLSSLIAFRQEWNFFLSSSVPALEKTFFLKTFFVCWSSVRILLGWEIKPLLFFVFFQEFCKQNGELVS